MFGGSGAVAQVQTHAEHAAHGPLYPSRGGARHAGARGIAQPHQDAR